ncbi:MAG TPA: hypothetical protein VFQ61_36520 [Polyangiaceae bacterium]|nr:hypothetical protein [Polyangiaceae bacterium]
MNSVVQDVASEAFSTKSRLAGERLTVELVGCLDMETAPQLRRFLGLLTPIAEGAMVKEFEFHTQDLYLMSSSAISLLAAWIKSLKELAAGCRVKFRTNPNLSWQKRSLDPIRRLAVEVVSVE